jgi:(S)-ureidoglycine aminohydrolase
MQLKCIFDLLNKPFSMIKMLKMILFPVLFILMWSPSILSAIDLVSKVYIWEDLLKTKLNPGMERTILTGSTPLFEDIKVSVQIPTKSTSPGIRINAEYEELLIVKDGVVDVGLNGVKSKVSAGDVVLICAGEEYNIANASDKPAACFIFSWKTRSTPTGNDLNRKSAVYRWEDLAFVPSDKGGRRNVMQRPTTRLEELEIHVTTLNAGLPSHAAHTHSDDEFILVKTGNVEMSVSGMPYKAGVGSLYFLKGEDPHGIRNIGNTACEYYAIRMK